MAEGQVKTKFTGKIKRLLYFILFIEGLGVYPLPPLGRGPRFKLS